MDEEEVLTLRGRERKEKTKMKEVGRNQIEKLDREICYEG